MTDTTVPTYIQIGDESIDAATVTLPETERRFRAAWTMESDDVIAVDMALAREIGRDEIRRAREDKFKALDVEYMRLTEEGGDVQPLIARKQQLRDAPQDQRIDWAQDDVELAAVLDEILNGVKTV